VCEVREVSPLSGCDRRSMRAPGSRSSRRSRNGNQVDGDGRTCPKPVLVQCLYPASGWPPPHVRNVLNTLEGVRSLAVRHLRDLAFGIIEFSCDTLEDTFSYPQLHPRVGLQVAKPQCLWTSDSRQVRRVAHTNSAHAPATFLPGLPPDRCEDSEATRRTNGEPWQLRRAQQASSLRVGREVVAPMAFR